MPGIDPIRSRRSMDVSLTRIPKEFFLISFFFSPESPVLGAAAATVWAAYDRHNFAPILLHVYVADWRFRQCPILSNVPGWKQ